MEVGDVVETLSAKWPDRMTIAWPPVGVVLVHVVWFNSDLQLRQADIPRNQLFVVDPVTNRVVEVGQ